jgi:hypothetical protein
MNLNISFEPNERATSFSLADAVYRAREELYIDATVVAKMMLLEAEKDGAENE